MKKVMFVILTGLMFSAMAHAKEECALKRLMNSPSLFKNETAFYPSHMKHVAQKAHSEETDSGIGR